MSRKVEFSFDTDDQKSEFESYAKSKGFASLSAFVRWAAFAIRSKNRAGSHHPTKATGRTGAPLDSGSIHRVS